MEKFYKIAKGARAHYISKIRETIESAFELVIHVMQFRSKCDNIFQIRALSRMYMSA